MNIYCMDAETFYSNEFTLSALTTEEYVRDPRFEVHGWAIRTPDGNTFWLTHEQFVAWAATIDWSQTAVLCHHAQFDGLILGHHYGIKPKMFLDTLSMARLLIGNHLSVSLKSLAEHFGLDPKNVPYDLFKGKHWEELTPEVQKLVATGACHDVELTYIIFEKLMAGDTRAVQKSS